MSQYEYMSQPQSTRRNMMFSPDRNEILRSFYVLFQHFYGKLFTQFFKTFNKQRKQTSRQ